MLVLFQATLEGVFEVMRDSVDSVGVSILTSRVLYDAAVNSHFMIAFRVEIVGSYDGIIDCFIFL